MISLIICSRDKEVLQAASANVEQTIGTSYEIIAIDNSQGKYGICAAYNLGASRAQYEIVCFMHEDIRFRTADWGNLVAQLLQDQTIGVLGVAGGLCQLAAPAGWWGCGLELCRENVLNVDKEGKTSMDLRNPEQNALTDVATIDGLWMCSRRAVWQKHPFDHHTFTDFHFYDIDYCTELYKRGLRVCVSFQLLIEHHSRGSVNTMWVKNALKYYQKRYKELPFGPLVLPRSKSKQVELRALQEFTGRLIRGNFASKLVSKYLWKCFQIDPLNRDTMWLAKSWLFSGS